MPFTGMGRARAVGPRESKTLKTSKSERSSSEQSLTPISEEDMLRKSSGDERGKEEGHFDNSANTLSGLYPRRSAGRGAEFVNTPNSLLSAGGGRFEWQITSCKELPTAWTPE